MLCVTLTAHESALPRLLAPALPTTVDTASEAFCQNRSDVLEQLAEIDQLLDEADAGGGPAAMERLRGRGKLPIRERIANVIDPNSPFLEISALAAYESDYVVGGGMVVGVGVIGGTECVIMGNDPSVLAGALTPYASKKWMRALEIARDNHIPYVSFVESAGADLRLGGSDGGGSGFTGGGGGGRRSQLTHFAETGRFFYEMIELSKMRIPTVCVVFGSSTAGGAYQPGLSDYNIVVSDQSKVFLAGPPLVKMATGEESDDETLGGARLHAETSGLGDYFAVDEMDAIRMCREAVSHLNRQKPHPAPTMAADPPVHDPEELLGLVSRELRQPFDMREVITRVVDGSRFEEYKARYGTTLVCGWASICGYPVGILANNGVLYPDSSQKGATFIQLCNQSDIPLVFLQNITGFMVGRDYEADGMVKKGSQMINAVTNSTVPASHGDHRVVVWRWHLRHVGTGLRQSLHVAVAHRQDRGDGTQADRRGDVAGAPGPGGPQGRAVRRGGGRPDRGPGRGHPGARLDGAAGHRRHQRRRHHRPPRHPGRARHVPVGGGQSRHHRRRGLRSVPAVSASAHKLEASSLGNWQRSAPFWECVAASSGGALGAGRNWQRSAPFWECVAASSGGALGAGRTCL